MRLGLRESFFEYFKGPGITISLKLIEKITFKLNFNLKKNSYCYENYHFSQRSDFNENGFNLNKVNFWLEFKNLLLEELINESVNRSYVNLCKK